jgi:hypothetical protein
MGRIYPTKVDWWIGLILIFTVVVLIGSAVPFFIGPPAQSPLGLGIGVLCLALAVWTGWIPYNTKYEIGQTELIIRSAGFRWRVPLDSIVEVVPTHNPLGSPACSLDRLRVNYRNPKATHHELCWRKRTTSKSQRVCSHGAIKFKSSTLHSEHACLLAFQ